MDKGKSATQYVGGSAPNLQTVQKSCPFDRKVGLKTGPALKGLPGGGNDLSTFSLNGRLRSAQINCKDKQERLGGGARRGKRSRPMLRLGLLCVI